MATPPTRVSYNTPTLGYGSTTATKTSPAFDVQSGDLITFIASGENETATIGTPSATGGAITWTSRQSIVVSLYCTMYVWTGAVGATATGITVSATAAGGKSWSFGATVWRNHGGVGVSGKTNVASGAPSLTLTGVSANSAIVCGSDDWNAADGTTRTWRTVNGAAMTESLYFRNSATYTVYSGYAPNAGAGGSIAVGLSAPGAQKYSIAAVEVLGTTGGGSAFTGSASLSGSGALTNSGTPKPVQNQALTGSGAVTGTGTPATSGSESGTGSGSLSLGAVPGFSGPFSGSGSGALSLSGMAVYVGSAALSGVGTVTLGGTPKAVNSTAPSGAGTLALGGTPTPTGSAPLTGSGTLSLSGTVGGGGPVSYSGLVMLTGDGGLSGSGAPAPTGTLSLGGTGFITLSAAGRTMYQFDPPGKQLSMDPTGRDFLWSKVKFFRGDAVVRYTSGAFKQVTTHDPDENGIDKVYLGGHSYVIEDSVAAELIQAGYGPYLKVVTS